MTYCVILKNNSSFGDSNLCDTQNRIQIGQPLYPWRQREMCFTQGNEDLLFKALTRKFISWMPKSGIDISQRILDPGLKGAGRQSANGFPSFAKNVSISQGNHQRGRGTVYTLSLWPAWHTLLMTLQIHYGTWLRDMRWGQKLFSNDHFYWWMKVPVTINHINIWIMLNFHSLPVFLSAIMWLSPLGIHSIYHLLLPLHRVFFYFVCLFTFISHIFIFYWQPAPVYILHKFFQM